MRRKERLTWTKNEGGQVCENRRLPGTNRKQRRRGSIGNRPNAIPIIFAEALQWNAFNVTIIEANHNTAGKPLSASGVACRRFRWRTPAVTGNPDPVNICSCGKSRRVKVRVGKVRLQKRIRNPGPKVQPDGIAQDRRFRRFSNAALTQKTRA